MSKTLQNSLNTRYSDAPKVADLGPALDRMAGRGSCRAFEDRHVPDDLLQTLCAVALAAPSKSDLQQRDIVLVSDPKQRASLANLVGGQAWVSAAPMLVVFCGNNRRQRLLHDWHDVPFANDHIDAFFNASVDAAIALGAFVTAAEAVGLGCCPISALRNQSRAVSDLLGLPDHVFPIAGLAVGYAAQSIEISARLPLSVTVHRDRYQETDLRRAVDTYDKARAHAQPYANQRLTQAFGIAEPYTWSQDKVRQYSQPERVDFGGYLRAIGFKLT